MYAEYTSEKPQICRGIIAQRIKAFEEANTGSFSLLRSLKKKKGEKTSIVQAKAAQTFPADFQLNESWITMTPPLVKGFQQARHGILIRLTVKRKKGS